MSRTGEESNFSEIEKQLNKVGIAMRSDADTIRPMNDILSDLALKWKTLTDVQKENIAQEAAGVYRRNYFIALMNNYNDVLKNTDAAINSNGVAMQKQEIYSNSLQAATQRLTAEWEKFYLGIIKSDYIRTAVSGLSSFIEIINRTTTGLGGLKTALMLLTTGVIIKFVSSLYSAAAGAGILETAIVALQLGVKGLSAALLGLVTNPVTLLVTALVAIPVGIMAWTNAQQKLKEQLEATTKAQNDFNKAHQEFNKSLDPNKINEEAQALEELKKALNYDEATKKVEELQNKIDKLQENIKKGEELGFDTSGYRDALSVYEDELSKYEGTIKKVSDTEKQYNKDKELSIALDYESAQQKAKSIALKVQEANSNIQVANSYKTVYDKLVNGIALTQEETQLNEKLIQQYPQHVELLNKKTGAIGVNLQALTSNVNLQKQLAEVEFNEYKLSIQANAEKTKQLIDETQKRVTAIQAEIDSLDVLINKYNDLINSGKGDLVTEKLGVRAFQRQDSLRQSLVDAQNQLTKLKATNSAYDSVLNASYEDLLKGSSSGYISSGASGKSGSSASEIDVKEALVTKDRYFELNQELEKTNILLTKNKALQENADYQTKIKLMDEEINLLKQKQDNLHNINEERRKERDELVKTLSASGINFTGEGDNITPTNGAAVLQSKADEVNAHRFDKDKTLYKQLKEEFDDLQTAYNRFFEVYKDIGNTSNDWLEVQKAINGINTDKLKSASEEIKKITDSLNDYKNDLQDLMNTEEKAHQNRLDAIEEEKKAFDDYIDDKLSKLEREKEAQDYSNDINDLTEELNKLQQERTKYSMAATSGDSEALSKISDLDEQIAEKKKSISEKQSDREYQLRKENLQDIKNKQDEEYDSQKDTENKKYEAMKETYNKLKTDIENFAQAGINANSTMVDSIIADYNNLAAQFGSSTQKMASVFASSFLSKLQEAKNQLTQIKSQLGITNTSSNSSKTIEDYQADYIAAKAAGNWQAMEAANKAANKLRGLVDSSGEGIVTAIEDIKNVRGYATGTDDVLSLVGEHGAELRVLNPNGKDSIIPNGLTANLVNFAKNPIDFMSNIMSSFTFNIPKIASVGNSGYGDIILNVSMPVYGNVDQSTANTITNNFATTLKSTLTKAGIINR